MTGTVERATALLFVATTVMVVDVRIAGFDVINDIVGIGLVVVGLAGLTAVTSEDAARRFWGALALAVLVSVLVVVEEVTMWGGGDPPYWLVSLAGLLTIAGVILLAAGMRDLAAHIDAPDLERSWRLTGLLVLFVAAVPAVLTSLLAIGAADPASPTGHVVIDPNMATVPFILVIVAILAMAVPVAHLLISLDRTRRRLALMEMASA